VLLDFGSARQTLTEASPTLSPSYTPGFAPPEQYFDRKALGPWSDIYSVGASMYACLTRSSPPAADQRSQHDAMVSAVKIGHGKYSERLLQIIDWCMQLDPLQRPQSVLTLQKSLLERIPHPPSKPSLLSVLKKRLTGISSS
jgi:serine/threonine protein kinase